MHRIISAIIVISVISLAIACGGQKAAGGGAGSPTEAYKNLFAAVKSKDTEAIKSQMTKKTIEMGIMQSQRNKKTLEQVYENGFTATTFAETLPNIRDERVNGEMGNIEVWNSKDSKWEDLPFMKEDGTWKIAIGDLFAGAFVSPGPGRDFIEKQAANAVSNSVVTLPNTNSRSSVTNSGPLPPKSNNNSK
jgi:hypothetical protein